MILYWLRKWRAISPTFPPDTTTFTPSSDRAFTCCIQHTHTHYITAVLCKASTETSNNFAGTMSNTKNVINAHFPQSNMHTFHTSLLGVTLTLSIRSSSPLLNVLSSLAVFRSTVPLVSVAVESNGHEYTAILASVARSMVPAGTRHLSHQDRPALNFFQDTKCYQDKLFSGHLFSSSLTFHHSLEDHAIHDRCGQHPRALHTRCK